MNDRSANRAPELVLVISPDLTGQIEVVPGIEIGVAQEFEQVSVEAVGTGFGDDVDLPAAEVSVLGIVVVCQDAKFRDGVKVGNRSRPTVAALLDGCSIQKKAVISFALTVHGQCAP